MRFIVVKKEIEETQRVYEVEADCESVARDIVEGNLNPELPIPIYVRSGIRYSEFVTFPPSTEGFWECQYCFRWFPNSIVGVDRRDGMYCQRCDRLVR